MAKETWDAEQVAEAIGFGLDASSRIAEYTERLKMDHLVLAPHEGSVSIALNVRMFDDDGRQDDHRRFTITVREEE